jgi:hypothetical protein
MAAGEQRLDGGGLAGPEIVEPEYFLENAALGIALNDGRHLHEICIRRRAIRGGPILHPISDQNE